MENNNIVSAPQLADVDKYYNIWKENHFGTKPDFIDFMMSPTPERDMFIASLNPEIVFVGAVASLILI